MDSYRIAGFVPGPVLHHGPTEPLPNDSSLRRLSPHLLLHLPSHCTTHRVWKNPRGLDVTLPAAFNEGYSPIVTQLHIGGSFRLITSSAPKDLIALFYMTWLISAVLGNQAGIYVQGTLERIIILRICFYAKWNFVQRQHPTTKITFNSFYFSCIMSRKSKIYTVQSSLGEIKYLVWLFLHVLFDALCSVMTLCWCYSK